MGIKLIICCQVNFGLQHVRRWCPALISAYMHAATHLHASYVLFYSLISSLGSKHNSVKPGNKDQQEAFRERRHVHVCDLWPCGVTLTFRQGQENWCHYMPLIILYLVTKYIVYGLNTLQDITICLFYVTFDLHLRHSDFVKVACTFIVRCVLCCEMFVSKKKFVGSVEFEIWTFEWRKHICRHYDVITHFYEIQIQRAYLTGIPNFSLIKQRSDIYSWKVNRESWRKMDI